MTNTTRVLFFLLLISPTTILLSQKIPYKSYTTKNGLPSSVVYKLCEDKRGYLWVSTNFGISRFDGYRFVHYPNDKFQGGVYAMYPDNRGGIWVGTLHGIFYVLDNTVKEFTPKNKALNPPIRQLCVDKEERIWIVNKDYEIGYIKNQKYNALAIKNAKGQNLKVYDVFVSQKQTLIATEAGIYVNNKNLDTRLLAERLAGRLFFCIAEGKTGIMYFGSKDKIFSLENQNFDSIGTNKKPVFEICIINNKSLMYSSTIPGCYLLRDGKEIDLSKYLDLDKVLINDIH